MNPTLLVKDGRFACQREEGYLLAVALHAIAPPKSSPNTPTLLMSGPIGVLSPRFDEEARRIKDSLDSRFREVELLPPMPVG